MSDLPDHMRDHYGSTTDPSDPEALLPQQPYYPSQSRLPYHHQQAMNPQAKNGRQAALNMASLAAALPDQNYAEAFAQLQFQQQHYQNLPAAGLAYQLQLQQQQAFAQGPAGGHPSRTQQPSLQQQYAPQFHQFQGMYVPTSWPHMQALSGVPMGQQGYAGGFAPQQQHRGQQEPPFFYQRPPMFAGQTALFPGHFVAQHEDGSSQGSRRPSEQLSVGGSDVGRASSAGESISSTFPPSVEFWPPDRDETSLNIPQAPA